MDGTSNLVGTVSNLGDINPPERTRRAGSRDGDIGDPSIVLGFVAASKGDLSIGFLGTTISDGLEPNANDIRGDLVRGVQVVYRGGDLIANGGDIGREIVGTESNKTLDIAAESRVV